MSNVRIVTGASGNGEPPMMPNTYWFHIFQTMIDHDLANLGPYAFTVYCVIKSHSNIRTGVAIAQINTIARKAGISARHVMRQIKRLESEGYVSTSRLRKHNEYRLNEKTALFNENGCRQGHAGWEYRPLQIENTVKELKRKLQDIEASAQIIHTQRPQIKQVPPNDSASITQAELDELAISNPYIHKKLLAIRDVMQRRSDGTEE